jgi:hypothetical protein
VNPSSQRSSEQLKEIIDDKKNADNGAKGVQEQVVDDEKVLNLANTSLVVNIVPSTINNKFEHECLDEEVRLLNVHPNRQSIDDCVPGHKY